MTVATEHLIRPHGGELVDRTGPRPDDVDALEAITLTSRELSDLDMLASGALSPLAGFLGREDYELVVEEMRLASGLRWALPVCLAVEEAPKGDRVALADESGRRLAVLEVEEVYAYDREREAERCFRTTDGEHPGVARLYAQHGLYLAGPVTVFERLAPDFPALHRDPAETRAVFAERGWRRVVGFQTRNPIHRAHEYLTKCALETVDGLLIHPLVGETKSDDVPRRFASTRTRRSSRATTRRTACSCRRSRRRCATRGRARRCGTRSAGRTGAARTSSSAATTPGVGSYYGTYDAQLIFDEFEPHELDIEPMFFEHSFWCKACGQMASAKTCPHSGDDHVFLSGTKVREMLGNGEVPPVEFTRTEVAEILIEAYRAD